MTPGGDVRIETGLLRKALGTAMIMAALGAGAVAGQMADEEEYGGFDLMAAVGLLTPIADLTTNPDSYGTSMKVSVAVTGDATMWLSKRFGVAATGLYAALDLQARKLLPGEQEPDLGSAKYVVGAVSGIYRFVGEGTTAAIEPYLFLGAGVRHLKVDDVAAPELETSTDPVVTLGGGIRFEGIEGVLMRVEARELGSFYQSPATGDSRLQNDVLFTFAIGARLR